MRQTKRKWENIHSPLHSSLFLDAVAAFFSLLPHNKNLLRAEVCQEVLYSLWLACRLRESCWGSKELLLRGQVHISGGFCGVVRKLKAGGNVYVSSVIFPKASGTIAWFMLLLRSRSVCITWLCQKGDELKLPARLFFLLLLSVSPVFWGGLPGYCC